MKMQNLIVTGTGLICTLLAGTLAFAQSNEHHVIHFENLENGQIVDQPFKNVSVSNVNMNNGYAVQAFDTRVSSHNYDGLLGADGIERKWAGGNLKNTIVMGNSLAALPTNQTSTSSNTPGATVSFEFAHPIDEFGFDMLNVQPTDRQSKAVFYNGNDQVAEVKLRDFTNPAKDLYDPTIEFGSRTANRIRPITADDLKTSEFTRVELHLAENATAIDNITYKQSKPLSAIYLNFAAPPASTESTTTTGSIATSATPPLQPSNRLVSIPSISNPPTTTSDPQEPQNPEDPKKPEPPVNPPIVPTPSAIAAGLIMLSTLGLRRNRK
ncbi:hypothetical protein KS4_30580 [Poriferisphaera corsica]|uniref:PEP-CTERM sorting domain-containing protein n=1 Tax=Poriferisphaera corsica TaxID=2528020 RepID=A0A517YXP0_9BACT|nr:hypothetical protein [Poriferisphaera corsica]QDU34981.1 hypothetical protein KS4_30580 [Poriferisphaera corsica]